MNKFEQMKLTKQKAKYVACPMIKESPVNIECRVEENQGTWESRHVYCEGA